MRLSRIAGPVVERFSGQIVRHAQPYSAGVEFREHLGQNPTAAIKGVFDRGFPGPFTLFSSSTQPSQELTYQRRNRGVQLRRPDTSLAMSFFINRNSYVAHVHSLTTSAIRNELSFKHELIDQKDSDRISILEALS